MVPMAPTRHASFVDRTPGVIRLAIAVIVGVLSAAATASADDANFLVSRPDMIDPLFEQSVILMLPAGSIPLVDGVIINKPTTIGVKKAFPHSLDLASASDVIYFGGPVDLNATLMVRRTASPSRDEHRVFGDLYLSVDPKDIAAILQDPHLDKANVRIFQGYSQWGVEQLRSEKVRGSWYEVPVSTDAVFSASPAKLWDELVAKGRIPEVEPPSQSGGSLLKIRLQLPPIPPG